jgi:hypothetical protein
VPALHDVGEDHGLGPGEREEGRATAQGEEGMTNASREARSVGVARRPEVLLTTNTLKAWRALYGEPRDELETTTRAVVAQEHAKWWRRYARSARA